MVCSKRSRRLGFSIKSAFSGHPSEEPVGGVCIYIKAAGFPERGRKADLISSLRSYLISLSLLRPLSPPFDGGLKVKSAVSLREAALIIRRPKDDRKRRAERWQEVGGDRRQEVGSGEPVGVEGDRRLGINQRVEVGINQRVEVEAVCASLPSGPLNPLPSHSPVTQPLTYDGAFGPKLAESHGATYLTDVEPSQGRTR